MTTATHYPPGIRHGLSNAAYHASGALSCSEVKRLRKSPFHYHAHLTPTAPPKLPTAAMLNGTLVHCALLEPAEFDKRYVVGPEVSKNSNAWKIFKAEREGAEVITQVQRDAAFAQAANLRALPEVDSLMADGMPEVSAFWFEDDAELEAPVMCRCRPDWVGVVAYGTGAVLIDVKTGTDASPEGFSRAVQNFSYHLQADWYCRGYAKAAGIDVHGMVFAVVENEFPYAAAAYMLSDAALIKARAANREALKKYAQCRAAQSWPGYAPGITVIDLPPWA